MKQAGYYHVQNIPIHEREAIKQLQLLIQDGYMVGFAGTGSLAAYILDPEQGAPASKNVVQRFMDGHFFIIRDIKFDEEKDMVDVRIMTWGRKNPLRSPLMHGKKYWACWNGGGGPRPLYELYVSGKSTTNV